MKFLNQVYPLSESTLQRINELTEPTLLKRGEILIHSEQVCEHLYILESGAIKSYHSDELKDYTSWIYFEEEIVTSWHSYALSIPSLESFVATEDSTYRSLSKESIELLKKETPDFILFLNANLKYSAGFYDYFTKKMNTSSAEENYNFILENYPKLIQRSSNSDIASIIGVSRETISRIRKS